MKKSITGNYASHTKEELLGEVELRELSVDDGAVKADIIAVLQLDDETNPPDPLPKLSESPIPQVESKASELSLNPAQPNDSEFTDGIYVKESDGEQYAVCITEPREYENTHFAKNSVHFWSGRATDFKLLFNKK